MAVHIVKGDLTKDWLQLAEKQSFVALDIETTGLNVFSDTIALVQVHIPDHGTLFIQNLAQYPTKLLSLLESKRVNKVFHYAQFDLSFFMRDFPIVQPHKIADTYIAAKTLDPNKDRFSSYSLQNLVNTVFGYYIDKSVRISKWDTDTLTDDQVRYAEDDVRYLVPLLAHLEERISPYDLARLSSSYHQIPRDVMLALKG